MGEGDAALYTSTGNPLRRAYLARPLSPSCYLEQYRTDTAQYQSHGYVFEFERFYRQSSRGSGLPRRHKNA
jgi:hypothetical protein